MKELIQSITKKEWWLVALFSLILIILTGLPYLYAYLTAPSGLVYNGLNSLTPADNPVYYSYINQVKRGEIFLKDLFTPEPQSDGLFNIFWFSLGILARVFNLSAIFTFHLVRLLLIPVFLAVAYIFISLFFNDVIKRKWSLILLSFSSGIGAYFVYPLYLYNLEDKPGFWSPLDTWVPESITFLTLYKTPHFIASLILMFLILLLVFLALNKRKISYVVVAGLLSLVYFNFHPFYIPTIFLTVGIYLLILIFKNKKILWREVSYYLLFILISSPSIFYHLWTLSNNEVLVQRALQNINLAPPFIFIIIGYGFLWPLGLIGFYSLIIRKELDEKYIFLLSLILACIILIRLPLQFQTRYTQGLHLSLVIFSVSGLFYLKERFLTANRIKRYDLLLGNKFLGGVLLMVLLCMSNIFTLVRDFYYFTQQPGQTLKYFYMPSGTKAAMQKLAEIKPEGVVLADLQNSLFIPVYSAHQVYSAHLIESSNYSTKKLYLSWFFSNDRYAKEKQEFLVKNNIDYLLIDQSQKKSGFFNPESKDYLKLIYKNSDAEIYQVIK